MLFTTRNATDEDMRTRVENLLSQVTSAIARPEIRRNDYTESQLAADPMRHNNSGRPKVQNINSTDREKSLFNLLQKNSSYTDTLPMNNYWLSQRDPDYVTQEENEATIIPRRRKIVPNPAQGVKDYLGNWMSPDDLKKALHAPLPNSLAEGATLSGGTYSTGSTDQTFTHVGIGFPPIRTTTGRAERLMRARWQREII